MGRLHGEAGGGAWCPAQVVTNTSRPEWLMVDLEEELRLTGVIVQGRWDRGLGQEWAQEVKIQTWAQESGDWVTQGADRRLANTDTLTPALVRLEPPALARRLRVIPVSEHARTVCIRLEICGCSMEEKEMVETFEDVHDEVHDVSEEVHLRPQVTSAHISSSDKSSRGYEPGYMSMVIAVLVSVILILTLVIIFILYNNSNRSASQQQQTTAPVSQHSYSEYQALPPADYVSHYSNDSNYSEYSRPLLGPSSGVPPAPVSGSSPAHKMLWDISWPPPPLSSSSARAPHPCQPQHYYQSAGPGLGAHHYASTSVMKRALGTGLSDLGHPV